VSGKFNNHVMIRWLQLEGSFHCCGFLSFIS
jgi:hypothetical protein